MSRALAVDNQWSVINTDLFADLKQHLCSEVFFRSLDYIEAW